MHLSDARRALITAILADWDGETSFQIHTQNWQDVNNSLKQPLILEAMGRRYKVEPVPFRTIKLWAKRLGLELPRSTLYRGPEKAILIRNLLQDWDRLTPLSTHAEEWQNLNEHPERYALILEALGNRFDPQNLPIPLATLQRWMRQLKIKVPRSRRTQNPCQRTLQRWKKHEGDLQHGPSLSS